MHKGAILILITRQSSGSLEEASAKGVKMSIRAVFKSASAALAVMAFGISGAIAQTCDITELGSANGEIYLHAQNELIVNNNAAAALAGINELRAQPLNCYEEGAVLGLSAQVKLAQQDYLGAAVDLRTSLNKGYIPAVDRPKTFKALSQIYFAENQYLSLIHI